jgi:hypothetical protein
METGDANYIEFKDFTATVLLKMEHRRHMVFEKNGIQSYASEPSVVFK